MSGLVCGLDVHKRHCEATVIDWFGNVIESRRISKDELYSFLSSMNVSLVAVESSSYVHPMYSKLRAMGLEVIVAHPKKTRLIAENRLKSDRRDSECLAELARLGALPSSYVPEGEVARMRELVRRRAFLVRLRTRLKNRITATLALEGVEVPKGLKLFTRNGLEWLRSLGMSSIDRYLRILEGLNQEIGLVSKELDKYAGDEDVRLLMTIPGVGLYSALMIKAEIGDLSRFPDADHLCSYAGLVPSERSSGGRTRRGRITEEGSRWLRWIMVEVAHVHVRYDTHFTRAYHRIAARRGKKVATVALARRLLRCVYAMLRDRKPFVNRAQAR